MTPADANRSAARTAKRFRRVAFVFRLVRPLFATVDVKFVSSKPVPGTPVIFVANHRSFFDIPVGFEFFRELGFAPQVAVHRRFFNNRVLGALLRYFGAVPVGKGDGKTWVDGAAVELAAGRSIALMPEGKITAAGTHVGQLRSGVMHLADQSGAVVVPIGVTGTDEVWPLGRALPRLRLRRANIRARIGAPMSTQDTPPDQFVDTLADVLAELIGPE